MKASDIEEGNSATWKLSKRSIKVLLNKDGIRKKDWRTSHVVGKPAHLYPYKPPGWKRLYWKSIKSWCEILDLSYHTVRRRLYYLGWSVEDAFKPSTRPKKDPKSN